jgi:hypothetical protein
MLKDNTETDLRQNLGGAEWFHLSQDSALFRDVMKAMMNSMVP